MADLPSKPNDGVLSCSVYCNGSKLDDNFKLVSASVHLELNRIGQATLAFNAGNADKQTFDESDSDLFKPGNKIRLDAGSTGNEETLFDGIITGLRVMAGKDSRPGMVVECRDRAYPATAGRKNRVFEKKTDHEMIKEVLSGYGTVKVDATPYQHPTLVQYYCTDWDFVLSRADANGLFIYTKGSDINVCKPDVNASPVLTVTSGSDLVDFDLELSGSDQFTRYEAVSWNPDDQSLVRTFASPPVLNKQGNLQPRAIATGDCQLFQTGTPTEEEVLKQRVDSMALKAGLARYRGTCRFRGTAKVVPGCLVELKGLGKRFDGNMFVGAVTHILENDAWLTEAGAGVSPANITGEPGAMPPAASAILPGLEGLHGAVVKKLDGDPGKEHRILVELPWMNSAKKEFWAPFSTLYATCNTGDFFLPEPGDEVLVGFLNQDPGHPVILGVLRGKKHQSPLEHEAENRTKAIVTRENMKIEFNEEKKIITISTPGKNQIEISDDGKSIRLTDQHRNEIVMNDKGISLSSSKDITLKANGNITADASMKATVTAKSDVAVEGMNVKVNAKTSAVVKGSASAELSASGQTVVKGGIVMIN